MAALAVMLAAVGSLCGAVYSEAINPALYGEKSRAAVAQAHGMRDDDAVTAYIGMDAARQNEAAKIIALYMELGGEDTPLAVDDLDLAFSYIAQENLQAAKELLDKLENAILQLGDFPYLGVVFPNKETYEVTGYRYLAVDTYVVFYRIDDVQKEIQIARVFHSRQNWLYLALSAER